MSSLSSLIGGTTLVVVDAANPTVAANAVVPLTASFDPAGLWDGTNYKLTATEDSVWKVTVTVPVGSRSNGAGYAGPSVRKNGSVVSALVDTVVLGDSKNNTNVSVRTTREGVVVMLAATDYIDVVWTLDSGSAAVGTWGVLIERLK